MKKQISVVVPTLNSAATLDWTLLSLRSQQDCKVRIIVVDSGSTDGTLEICKRWGIESQYVPPGNMYRAINAGIRLCNTDWVTYLNSDDIVYRDSYARLIELGTSLKAHVVYGYSDYIDWDGRFLFSFRPAPPSWLGSLFRKGFMGFTQPAAIFRHDVFKALRGFSEDFCSISDFDFFSRALKAQKVFKLLRSPAVSAFRLHQNQFSQRESEVTRKEKELLFASSANSLDLGALLAFSLWRIRNVKSYFLRLLRTHSLRGRWS
ncbi:MAG: glycosyltransferase [Planctomycetota bacterium]|jgi:glycosyltransferase involved in cell wall biosynthesis